MKANTGQRGKGGRERVYDEQLQGESERQGNTWNWKRSGKR